MTCLTSTFLCELFSWLLKFLGVSAALLFSSFRFGWKMTVHSISQKRSSLKTFMVVAEKEMSIVLHEITSSFDLLSLGRNDTQVKTFMNLPQILTF